MTPKLHEAYQNTDYTIEIDESIISLRIGNKNEEWSRFLIDNNFDFYFYITAHNPYSELKSDEENGHANQKLKEKILELELQFLNGVGKSVDSDWEEKSFCVLGGNLEIAVQLGTTFKQNAIVCGSRTEAPRLVYM